MQRRNIVEVEKQRLVRPSSANDEPMPPYLSGGASRGLSRSPPTASSSHRRSESKADGNELEIAPAAPQPAQPSAVLAAPIEGFDFPKVDTLSELLFEIQKMETPGNFLNKLVK